MLLIAVVQTKVITCSGANNRCLLQAVRTKAIAALTQFCGFLSSPEILLQDLVLLSSLPYHSLHPHRIYL